MMESPISAADEFVEKSLNHFLSNVTERVFMSILNDRDLRQEYLDLVRRHDGRGLDAYIGRLIREKLPIDDVATPVQSAEGEG